MVRTMAAPLVSVLLPVFNGEAYLPEAIESVLGQTFEAFEFIIVNDGSSDRSSEIIASYIDQRIHCLNFETNVGLVDALNAGLSVAQGKYIARIDADDKWCPDKLEKQLGLFSERPEIALCGTWYTQIDYDGEVIRSVDLPVLPEENYVQLFMQNTFVHSGVMFQAQIVRSLGGYDSAWQHIEDYALWLALAEKYPVYNLPERLVYYRLHRNSVSCHHFKKQREKVLALRRKAFQRCGIDISDEFLLAISRERVLSGQVNSLKHIHQVICAHAPKCLDVHQLLSICRQLEDKNELGLGPVMKSLLVELWQSKGGKGIAFYAGGSLADNLLDELEARNLPLPQVIFDKFPERSQIKRVKVEQIDSLPTYDIETILITHEQLHAELYQTLTSMGICRDLEIIDPWQNCYDD